MDGTGVARYREYELMFIKIVWVYLFSGIAYYGAGLLIQRSGTPLGFGNLFVLSFIIFMLGLNLLKKVLLNKNLLESALVYYIFNTVWLSSIIFTIIFLKLGYWDYALVIFTIMVTGLTKGIKTGMHILFITFFLHVALTVIAVAAHSARMIIPSDILFFIFLYLIMGLFTLFTGMANRRMTANEAENRKLMQEIRQQYEELKGTNEKLGHTNKMLEDTNKKLSESIAEFYTLQRIGEAIGSILDIKELLKYLNDIILGVMGVNNSTIILYDEASNHLMLHTSNISNPEELLKVGRNINCPILFKTLASGQYILENSVDPEIYPFTAGRGINSLISIPLNSKSRKFGLVLVERKFGSPFDEENVRLLNIIAQQVGIVMENADLYQKMQDLANKDGLTGIYNRQYIQERLPGETARAQSNEYALSLAIFDIDHFKKFNDTFGHQFGDKVIKSIVESVSASLGKDDIIARFGGEEFIILLPGLNLDQAFEKVDALRKQVSKLVITDSLVSASVTVSFGVSSLNECALNGNELVRTADDALYEAKGAGRNCVRVAKRFIE